MQIKGTAMYTRMVSSYANHMMGSLEDFLKLEDYQPDLWLMFS